MRYQIYEAKSVKYDAQQRVGIIIHRQKPAVRCRFFLLWKFPGHYGMMGEMKRGACSMEFHEKLQALRRRRGLTQEELAERLFVSRTAVSKWESGVSQT